VLDEILDGSYHSLPIALIYLASLFYLSLNSPSLQLNENLIFVLPLLFSINKSPLDKISVPIIKSTLVACVDETLNPSINKLFDNLTLNNP